MNTSSLKIPITFNYAIAISAFDLNDKIPKISIVDYKKNGNETQKRLPAGRFLCEDLTKEVEFFLQKKYSTDLAFFFMEAERLDKEYQRKTAQVKDFTILNPIFDYFTKELLEKLQKCRLNENDFFEIISETFLNTVKRELKEEIGTTQTGKIHLSSVSGTGPHYKVGFVSTEVKAPEFYVGSADPKIERSYWAEMEKSLISSLFNGHLNHVQEGIRKILEKEVLSPDHLRLLKTFLSAER